MIYLDLTKDDFTLSVTLLDDSVRGIYASESVIDDVATFSSKQDTHRYRDGTTNGNDRLVTTKHAGEDFSSNLPRDKAPHA